MDQLKEHGAAYCESAAAIRSTPEVTILPNDRSRNNCRLSLRESSVLCGAEGDSWPAISRTFLSF